MLAGVRGGLKVGGRAVGRGDCSVKGEVAEVEVAEVEVAKVVVELRKAMRREIIS